MEKFISHTGTGVPLRRSNVDTDQIIPAVYLKRVTRSGFEDGLFAAWRSDPEFVLNKAEYQGGTILVAGVDFGTGSSREHAVWALFDYGFRVAIAPSFGDIFASNALKNGFLPITLPEPVVSATLAHLQANPGARIRVDLEAQQVVLPDSGSHRFDIAAFARQCLLEGLDEIDYTLTHLAQLQAFERRHTADGY